MTELPPFAVSEFTTWHQSFEEDLALYRRLGIAGIEVCERKLSTDPGRARAQLHQIVARGLIVTSVQPRCHALFPDSMTPEVPDPRERCRRFRQTVDLFADALPGQRLTLVSIGGVAPGGNLRQAHQTARALYPELADYAAARGLRIAFEPLHPMFMATDGFICSLHEALELVADVNRPNFGLMLDLFHVGREPGVVDCIARLAGRLFGVHVSDWPRGGPRCQGDRVLPGDGALDWPALLGAIEQTGYDGPYCVEIFSVEELPDSLWRQNATRVIEQARKGFERVWRQANERW